MSELYYEFAIKIFTKLKSEVNGCVRYQVFKQLDAIIFTVKFKEFLFEYTVKDLTEKISDGVSADDIVKGFKEEYKKALMNAFFKTDTRKRRDLLIGYGSHRFDEEELKNA